MNRYLGEGHRRQAWLSDALRNTTGIDAVKSEDRPGISASVAVMINKAIGSESTERLSLHAQDAGLALCTWPAELKRQAEATYRTGRAQRLIDFAAAHPQGWTIWPNVHLAYRLASIRERVYLHHHFHGDEGLIQYINQWMGEDYGRIGGHHPENIPDDLWPWLKEHRYADRRDEQDLEKFLDRLGHRDAHLRPSIGLQRTWLWTDVCDLEHRDALLDEIRDAAAEVLDVLDEPLPPGCSACVSVT